MEHLINKIILVTGATGKQGGATARQLLKAGVKVRALTRKPNGKSAETLKTLGAEIVKGNLNDLASLDLAMQGISGVFCVTNFWEFGTGKKELFQSKNLADIARKHRVQHFVLASIARCDDNPDLAHFITKYEAEKYIQKLELPYTFLRTVYFMENLRPGDEGDKLHWAFMEKYLGSKSSIQMIACEDIGWFAANAFLNPEEWIDKTIDIAGDEVTYPKALQAYEKVIGKKPKYSHFMLKLACWLMPEIKKMFEWYRVPRFKTNIEDLRKIHPELMTLEDFFMKNK